MFRTLICSALLLLAGTAAWAQDAAPPRPCTEPEAARFDFWVGEWDVHANGRVVGRNRISRILGGCTLLEEYTTAPRPYEGKSFNWYDASDGLWHQVWVDNGGTRLDLAGSFADGKMVLSGERRQGADTIIDRITWFDNADGTVRQLWETSRDAGATWTTAFDGLYKPAAGE